MIWMSISSKGASGHKSKQAINQETYLKEYIDKRLLPFIVRMEIICFSQSTLLKYCSRMFNSKKSLIFFRVDNPPKLVQLTL